MINRPKPPPHILKRLKQEEQDKKSRQDRKLAKDVDMKRMTANSFGTKLQAPASQEGVKTQYPFKPPLKQIQEENEEGGPYKNLMRRESSYLSEKKQKRGSSVNPKYLQSNGFTQSAVGNNTSYQNGFNETAISTSTSKNFQTSPMQRSLNYKSYKRSESLIARSSTYSQVPCPHCDRKFSSNAAERHIPICQKVFTKPATLRDTKNRFSNVQLPHLSKTNYASETFRTSETKLPIDSLSRTQLQTSGLPPTYKCKSSQGNQQAAKTKDFNMKR